MNESEAKTKWCPMVRFHNGDQNEGVWDNKPVAPENPYGRAGEHSVYCIASDCMWWKEDASDWKHPEGTEIKHGHCGAVK